MHKLLVVVIALATAGAQVVCACSTPVVQQAAPQLKQACAGEKECCRKAQSQPIQPAKQEPCSQCNLKHRAEQMTPDRQGDLVPHMELAAIAPIAMADNASFEIQPCLVEIVSSPPLLNDLFHVHSLLLN